MKIYSGLESSSPRNLIVNFSGKSFLNMYVSVFIYFGDENFGKLDAIESYFDVSEPNLSNVKLFRFLKNCPGDPINDVFLGWSYLLFRIGNAFFYSGFCRSGSNSNQTMHQMLPSLNDKEFIDVTCGIEHSFLKSKTGQLYTFDNIHFLPELIVTGGELYKFKCVVTEDMHSVALSEDGKVYNIDFKEFITVKSLEIPLRIEEVACGKEHVLFLSNTGRVFSYGFGSRGQLGHGNIEKQDKPLLIEALDGIEIKTIAAGGWHSAAISSFGDLYMWGWNESGQLGLPCNELHGDSLPMDKIETVCCLPKIIDLEEGIAVVSVSCGSRHTAAITGDNHIWTWGCNNYGQLGHKKTLLSDKPEKVLLPEEFLPQKIQCKFWSTLISGYYLK